MNSSCYNAPRVPRLPSSFRSPCSLAPNICVQSATLSLCVGTLIRYQQRQGKYRVKLEDGKEINCFVGIIRRYDSPVRPVRPVCPALKNTFDLPLCMADIAWLTLHRDQLLFLLTKKAWLIIHG